MITLGNSEKHIFHSDEDGVIQQWMEALRPVNTLATSSSTGSVQTSQAVKVSIERRGREG